MEQETRPKRGVLKPQAPKGQKGNKTKNPHVGQLLFCSSTLFINVPDHCIFIARTQTLRTGTVVPSSWRVAVLVLFFPHTKMVLELVCWAMGGPRALTPGAPRTGSGRRRGLRDAACAGRSDLILHLNIAVKLRR